ncbi:hypothetical protein CBP16_01170 [Fischerella thermalis WC217]|nr:hypothetical protein CBP16_01170 [Fischerella thermalis WC217]
MGITLWTELVGQGRPTFLTEFVGNGVFKFTLRANQHCGSSLIPAPRCLWLLRSKCHNRQPLPIVDLQMIVVLHVSFCGSLNFYAS